MSYYFIPCEDESRLAGLTRAYLDAYKVFQEARQAKGSYGQWKSHVEGAQKSKALLSDDQGEKDRALKELASRTETFTCARLILAALHTPLVTATNYLQSVLRNLVENEAEKTLGLEIQNQSYFDRTLYPFHLDILRVNMHVASELLVEAYSLLASPVFEDRSSINDVLPRSLQSLMGAKSKLVYLPKLSGRGNTLRGVAAWSAEILQGQTNVSWGRDGELGGYPEAARNIFKDAGWTVEYQQGATSAKSSYKMTPPAQPPEELPLK